MLSESALGSGNTPLRNGFPDDGKPFIREHSVNFVHPLKDRPMPLDFVEIRGEKNTAGKCKNGGTIFNDYLSQFAKFLTWAG